MRRRVIVLVVIFFCSLGAFAQSVERDITYTTDRSGSQKGDLYRPVGNGPFPAIVFVHGGAWRSGNKGSFGRLAADLATDGYVGFSINYTLKSHSFPLAWEETRAAIVFLRAHAAEYHVDPNRIVVAGTSAGGELAALTALAPEGPSSASDPATQKPAPVFAAIVLNGVFDLCYPYYVIKRYMGGSCEAKKAAYDDASPLRHVHPNAPPFFVGHGTKDHVVPLVAAEVFIRALQEDHVPVTLARVENGPHMYWQKKPFYEQNLHDIQNFLATELKQPPAASAELR